MNSFEIKKKTILILDLKFMRCFILARLDDLKIVIQKLE